MLASRGPSKARGWGSPAPSPEHWRRLLVREVRPERRLADQRPLALCVPAGERVRRQSPGSGCPPRSSRERSSARCRGLRRGPARARRRTSRSSDGRYRPSTAAPVGSDENQVIVRRQVQVVRGREPARERARCADVAPSGDAAAGARRSPASRVPWSSAGTALFRKAKLFADWLVPMYPPPRSKKAMQPGSGGGVRFRREVLARVVDDVEARQRVARGVLQRVRAR